MDFLASANCVTINMAGSYLWHNFASFGYISRNGVDRSSGRSILVWGGGVHMCRYICLSICILKRHIHAEDRLTLDLFLSDCPLYLLTLGLLLNLQLADSVSLDSLSQGSCVFSSYALRLWGACLALFIWVLRI